MKAPRPAAPNVRHETADHMLCDASTPGAQPFIDGGLQPDGTHLYAFDLDSHNGNQDAADLLAYGRQRAGTVLDKLAIIPTKRNGYHLPFRYHRPLNPGNIYDPRTQHHAGELLGQRIDPADAPLLTMMELLDLLRAFVVHGVFTQDDDQAPAELRGLTTTPRKDRIREGKSLIAGWGHIRDWRERLDRLCAVKPMLAAYRTRTRTHNDRSAAYGAFVQSLMLHAGPLGRNTGERCALVAAMAIGVGAGGKEGEKDYRIEKDTAALISKILHGDPMEPRADGTIPHWTVPKWYRGEPLPTPAPAPEPAAPPTTHATKRRDLRLAAIRRKLEATEPDELGRRRFLIERISTAPRRTTQADLKWLRDTGEIVTGQIDKNGAPYAILTAHFGGAKPCKKPDKPAPEAPDFGGASATAEYRAPMPESDDSVALCIDRTPKPCAPTRPVAEPGGASYDPALVKRSRRYPKQTPKVRAAAAKRRRQARLAAMDVAELKERRWRLARRAERAATAAQAEIFDDLLAEMTYALAKKAPGYDPDAYVWRNKDLQRRLSSPDAVGAQSFGVPLSAPVVPEPQPAPDETIYGPAYVNEMIARLKARLQPVAT